MKWIIVVLVVLFSGCKILKPVPGYTKVIDTTSVSIDTSRTYTTGQDTVNYHKKHSHTVVRRQIDWFRPNEGWITVVVFTAIILFAIIRISK